MPSIQNVATFAPTDYSAEAAAIERRRKLSESLLAQGQQPLDTNQMAGGYVVPVSPYAGLARALQSGVGAYQSKQSDDEMKALGERVKGDRSSDMQALVQALSGTPGRAEIPAGLDEFGGGPGAPAQAAVPGGRIDPSQIGGFKTPEMQNMALQMYLSQASKDAAPPEKIDLGDKWGLMKNGQLVGTLPKGATPDAVLKDTTARAKNDIAPSGVVFNPYQTQPGQVFNDPNKLIAIGSDGQPVVNQQLANVKKDIAAKGAANVNVRTDVKTGESLAAQVGPMMKDSTAIAEGAVKQVDAAQRIVQAVDSGKIITGPTADARLVASQIGQVLGVGGKDEAEKVANTRQALRGLAELTLQGRQQMKGQGAITESEGKLAEKAMSGEISFTAAEIKQLAKASERAARFNYAEHTRKLKVMEANPALQGIAPFYSGPAISPEGAGGEWKDL